MRDGEPEVERGRKAARDTLANIVTLPSPEDIEKMIEAAEATSERNPAWARGYIEIMREFAEADHHEKANLMMKARIRKTNDDRRGRK